MLHSARGLFTEIETVDVGPWWCDPLSVASWVLLSIPDVGRDLRTEAFAEKIVNLGVTIVFGAKQMLARA